MRFLLFFFFHKLIELCKVCRGRLDLLFQVLHRLFQLRDIVLDGVPLSLLFVAEFQLLFSRLPVSAGCAVCLSRVISLIRRLLHCRRILRRALRKLRFPLRLRYLVIRKSALVLLKLSISLEGENPADHAVQEIPVMGYRDDDSLEAVKIVFQDHQRLNIKVIRRLVQDQDIRCTHEDLQKVKASSLAAGQLLDHGVLDRRRE